MPCSAPTLKSPDTSKPYTLYTDASKYSWAGILIQMHTSMVNGKGVTMDHPVSYVSTGCQVPIFSYFSQHTPIFPISLAISSYFSYFLAILHLTCISCISF